MKKSIKSTDRPDTSMANGSYDRSRSLPQWDKNEVTVRLLSLVLDLNEKNQRELLQKLEATYADSVGKPSGKRQKSVEDMRQHPRKLEMIPVDCSTHNVCFTNFIHDISDGGVYIKTNAPFYVGQEIQLDFSIPETQSAISVGGEVVRVDAQGIGVKFTNAKHKH